MPVTIHPFACAALAATLAVAGTMTWGARSAEQGAPQYGSWGFDLSGMDTKAKPGDSFFEFANGGWVARTEIPADKTRFGMFDMLIDKVQEQLRSIIEAAAADAAKPDAARDTNAGKIGALFNAFMDEARIEALDAAPIAADLDRIRAATSKPGIATLMGAARSGLGASFFAIGVSEDEKGAELRQHPLRLPGRARAARSRLLSGGCLQGQESEIPRLCRAHARHDRLAGCAG